MSFAWATIALLVLMLPGFLFSVGVQLPEKFARDTAPASPLGQLAAVVAVSVLVHGLFFLVLTGIEDSWATVRLDYFFALLQLQGSDKIPLSRLAEEIRESRWAIFPYIGITSALGLALGAYIGRNIGDGGRFRRLVRHGWIYDLQTSDTGIVVAYVMTNVQHEEYVLMYYGELHSFALTKDGTFAYLALSDGERFYMALSPDAPTTTLDRARAIGAGNAVSPLGTAGRTFSYFVIEGEDIANIVFDRFDLPPEPGDLERLDELAREAPEKTSSPPSHPLVEMLELMTRRYSGTAGAKPTRIVVHYDDGSTTDASVHFSE